MKKIINTDIGLVIICLFTAVFVMADFIVIDKALDSYAVNNEVKKDDDEKLNSDDKKNISSEEALVIGKELFLKVNQYYDDTWFLSGYSFCDVDSNTGINEVNPNDYQYNLSKRFSSTADFKKYLSDFLSEDMINKEFDVNNNHILEYPEYKDVDGKLYCANLFNAGWSTRYTKKYDISVSEILENKIVYNITYYYCDHYIGNSVYTWDIESCSEENMYSKTFNFIVEKNVSGNFVVSNFVYHEAPFKGK